MQHKVLVDHKLFFCLFFDNVTFPPIYVMCMLIYNEFKNLCMKSYAFWEFPLKTHSQKNQTDLVSYKSVVQQVTGYPV